MSAQCMSKQLPNYSVCSRSLRARARRRARPRTRQTPTSGVVRQAELSKVAQPTPKPPKPTQVEGREEVPNMRSARRATRRPVQGGRPARLHQNTADQRGREHRTQRPGAATERGPRRPRGCPPRRGSPASGREGRPCTAPAEAERGEAATLRAGGSRPKSPRAHAGEARVRAGDQPKSGRHDEGRRHVAAEEEVPPPQLKSTSCMEATS